MNIKISVKYQFQDITRALIIFCGILLILILTLFIPGLQGTTNGLEISAFIFLFVIGLNTFKENFGMFLQNGVSRKTIFAGKLLSTCVVSAIMAVVLEVLSCVAKLGGGYRDIQLGTLYEMLYTERMASISPVLVVVENLLMLFCCCFAFMMVGYFITIAYYRMEKHWKLLISVGLPVLCFVLLPIVDTVLGGVIFLSIFRVLMFATGLQFGSPYICMLSALAVTAVFSGLSWLLMRRAVVKN
ncbi:hypothetical protein [Diplocloster agilis]|uniref:hypothetical protein n=1 Tax=Diplocloster agilis TaxID=2850323 RepID=UPI000820E1F9|nr:hypothetical protein [Suonthocola fibrivorans]MCU6732899.1 hypothetical protein [Suonthocola fibrivorans]SCI66365.1 Uncharacterised protein [uncultured Clostridium sp.]